MAKKSKEKAPRDKVRPEEVEAEVVDFLGSSGIHTTFEITRGIQRSRGRVFGACKRLHKREVLRLSKIPKTQYRFLLTNETLNGANYPVITRLIPAVRSASRQPGSLRARLSRVFVGLRAHPELKAPARRALLDKYQGAAKSVPSDEQLLARVALHPFRIDVTRWWPQALERKYEEPLGQAAERLDRRRIRTLSSRLAKNHGACAEQLGRNPSVEPDEVVKAIDTMLDLYQEMVGQLEESGIEELVVEHDEELGKLSARETIPEEDLEALPADSNIDRLLETARQVPLDEDRLQGDLVVRIPRELVAEYLRRSAEKNPKAKRPAWKRWLDKSMTITSGGILVAEDLLIALGFLAGGIVVGDLASIAATPIGAALGVTTSIYTGSKSALEAVKKLTRGVEESPA